MAKNASLKQGWAEIPVPGHSQEWEASDSLSRTLGMDFFIPFPFPNFGNGFFSFPSRSRILGMGFFHSLPIPEIWEWIFLFPSRSRISGIGFFNSLPVLEPSKVIPAHPWARQTASMWPWQCGQCSIWGPGTPSLATCHSFDKDLIYFCFCVSTFQPSWR